jgi:1-acyl-sn-glycerol-3-phosphate acyltransferase
MNNVIAAIRMLMFVAGTLVLVPLIMMVRAFRPGMPPAWLWHRYACFVFGIKVRFTGVRAQGALPTVFISNHLSYLDIIVMAGRLKARFVAKSEVGHWPVFGFLARLQRTIFIHRTRTALDDSRHMILQALREGDDIILFAEGTSTDGRTVLPFKASLLEVLYVGIAAQVQPVAITLEKVDGQKPASQDLRDIYAWWRPETTLAPHLWNFAKTKGAELSVHYLPVLAPASFADRKALTAAAHDAVLQVVMAGEGG